MKNIVKKKAYLASKLDILTQVKLEDMELTAEQQARLDAVSRTEASSALEGYAPLSEEGGYAYELQKQWVLGEITTEEEINLLKKSKGLV